METPPTERRVPRYAPAEGHPRPMVRRSEWSSLDGDWRFATDDDLRPEHPDDVAFDRTIRVPFAPETAASGINHTGYLASCWYQRSFEPPPLRRRGDRLLLH